MISALFLDFAQALEGCLRSPRRVEEIDLELPARADPAPLAHKSSVAKQGGLNGKRVIARHVACGIDAFQTAEMWVGSHAYSWPGKTGFVQRIC